MDRTYDDGYHTALADTGCRFSPWCLSCRLPKCYLDMAPEELRKFRQRERLEAMARANQARRDEQASAALRLYDSGMSVLAISRCLGIGPDTVARRLNERR